MTTRPPAKVVTNDLSAALPAGWVPTTLAALPPEPFDLAPLRLALYARVETPGDAPAVLLAAARGVALVASVAADLPFVDSFLDDLARLADVPQDQHDVLDGAHAALLDELAAGATLAAAGRAVGLSRRTVARRLHEGRGAPRGDVDDRRRAPPRAPPHASVTGADLLAVRGRRRLGSRERGTN